MALVSTGGLIVWPNNLLTPNAAPGVGNGTTLDAAGEYDSVVMCAMEAMTISHVGLRIVTATGSPTADIRIETVNAADGHPSGTLFGTNTNIVTGALSTGWSLHALTASASVPAGSMFAVKIAYATGTTILTGNFVGPAAIGLPYQVLNTGTPTKTSMSGRSWALGSSSTTFYHCPLFFATASSAQNSFNNTNGARRGARFQIPFPCQLVGLRYYTGTVVGDYNIAVFDDAGSELSSSSTAFEGDVHSAQASAHINIFFDNPVTLSPATWYRAVVEPSSATNVNMYTYTVPSADYRSATPGGTTWHYTTYASSAWDDTNTTIVPVMDLLVRQLSDVSSSTSAARVIGS